MRHIIVRGLVGLGLGLAFAVLEFLLLEAVERAFPDHTVQPMQSIYLVFSVLNAPAELLADIGMRSSWSDPLGESAFFFVPMGSILAQWGSIGLVGGLLWGWRSAVRKQGLCLKCGYDLTGNVSGVCPECGESVDRRQKAED